MQNTMRKSERQQLILDLIRAARIGTQAELRNALGARGVDCDQGTISRDIRELGLVKIADAGGHYQYARRDDVSQSARSVRLGDLKRLIRAVDWSANLLVIRTDPGHAPAAGEALDHLGLSEIIGTVAGDDTLLAVVREGATARVAVEKILEEVGK
jgi:transcriptional regulator of arginine metabolism